MRVGLDIVRLLYRFYVCIHLSKWFTVYLCFGSLFNPDFAVDLSSKT